MEQLNNLQTMLDQLDNPAFLTNSGNIVAVNFSASQRMAQIGMHVSDLFTTGLEEYDHLQNGCLYATVSLSGTSYSCTVTKLENYELFTLNETASNSALQALSLAASQLRIPIAELSLEIDQLKSQDDEMMSMVNQSIHRLQRIIGNMSDAAAYIDNTPRKSTQELCSLFHSILEKAETLLGHAGIKISYELPQQSIYCMADPDMLSRAIYNLLSNAAKFATSSNNIQVCLKKIGNKLYLTVSDNGDGVDQHVRPTMFSRYTRQPGIENPRHGLGLGMTLIHAAAAAHGGTVLVEQTENQGTKITMSITIEKNTGTNVRSSALKPDIYGGKDQALIELSDILPHTIYNKDKY